MSRALRVIVDNKPVLINLANIAKVTLDQNIIKLQYNHTPNGFFGALIVGSGYISSNNQAEILEAQNNKEAKEIFDKIEKLM
jgi:hypothetical protein